MLSRRSDRRLPLTLAFENAEQRQQVCTALGIGPAGFGRVLYRLGSAGSGEVLDGFRAAGTLLCFGSLLLAPLTTLWQGAHAETPLYGVGGRVGLFDLLMGRLSALIILMVIPTVLAAIFQRFDGVIEVEPEGLREPGNALRAINQWRYLADIVLSYKHIEVMSTVSPTVRIASTFRPYGWLRDGVRTADLKKFATLVRAGIARAKVPAPAADAANMRVHSLLRTSGETESQWRTHLDAQAIQMQVQGYRVSTFAPSDLQRVVSDPDLDPQLRGAAARVLLVASGEVERARIEFAEAALANYPARKQFRVALADVTPAESLDDAAPRTTRTRTLS